MKRYQTNADVSSLIPDHVLHLLSFISLDLIILIGKTLQLSFSLCGSSMRLYASKMGYTLSDQGLYPCGRDQKRVKTWKGSVVHCYTEREVFDALGLEYK